MDLRTASRRAALAATAGFALYAAHPPLRLSWLGPLALVPLLALARDLTSSGAAARVAWGWGTLAGIAFFGPLIIWIINIQEIVAWLLLVPVQALFVGAYVAGLRSWGTRPWRPVAAVALWVALEALRSAAPLGGFPWGVLGYTQHDGGMLLDVARSFGVLGVSAACAGIAAAVEEILARIRGVLRASPSHASRRELPEMAFGAIRAPLIGLVGILIGAVLAAGTVPPSSGASLDVAGIQGFDVEGSTGREIRRSIRIADDMLDVTSRALATGDQPDLVVWPENAFDGDPTSSTELAELLRSTLDLLDDTPLLTGVIEDGPRPATHVNSMLLYEGEIEPTASYVKRRLVPFGEYVPARRFLGWFPPLERVPSDGIPGTDPTVVEAAGARIGVGICFDVVFPHFFREQVRDGAQMLVLGTNNVSYGRSAMSDQHIAFSQLRAVESGRWVVHAALSGRSAIVDPTGGVHQRTGQYTQDVIRADIPLIDGMTLGTRVGDTVGWLAVGLTVLGLLWVGIGNRRPAGVTTPRSGHAGRMSDTPEEQTGATSREEVAEELDERDPLDDQGTEGRETDQAFEGNESMEGQQPSG